MSDKTLHMTMLFDFFGDLLTDKQHEYFDMYYNDDLSLSEISEMAGITRQGVFDIVTRAEKTLEALEQKTGVVRRWLDTRAELELAGVMARDLMSMIDGDADAADLARRLAAAIEAVRD